MERGKAGMKTVFLKVWCEDHITQFNVVRGRFDAYKVTVAKLTPVPKVVHF